MKKSIKLLITILAFVFYVWSIYADMLAVGGSIVIGLYFLWIYIPTHKDPNAATMSDKFLNRINDAAGVTQEKVAQKKAEQGIN